MGTLRFELEFCKTRLRLAEERHCSEFRDSAERASHYADIDAARKLVRDENIFAGWDLNKALFEYLNLSIDDSLVSRDPIIKAFAMLDMRLGKRRLAGLHVTDDQILVSQFWQLRCHRRLARSA